MTKVLGIFGFLSFGWADVLDILMVAVLIFLIIRSVRADSTVLNYVGIKCSQFSFARLGKADLLQACRLLARKNYMLYATGGTCTYLNDNGVPASRALWPDEREEGVPAALDLIRTHGVDLVINIPKDFTHSELSNGYQMRRAAIDFNVPLITNSRLATAYIRAFCALPLDSVGIKSWDEY